MDADKYWVKVGRLYGKDLNIFADVGGALWLNGYDTDNGQNDAIPVDRAMALNTVSGRARAGEERYKFPPPHAIA